MRINGAALRAIRERSGHTGVQLARAAEINRAYLSHIEAGRKQPSPEVTRRLASALKVPVTAILADPAELAS
jgi:transcriptional regulator with XRE-family HTH domain